MNKMVVGSILILSSLVLGHGGGHPTRYVAVSGVDTGECGTPKSACKTINYAVGRSNKGDTIRVAAGHYTLDELDVFYLLSDMIPISGGYSLVDNFATAKPELHTTTIVGVPFEYRQRLSARGFHLIQDTKNQYAGLRSNEKAWLSTYAKMTSSASAAAACINGMAGNNPCSNIDLVAHVPLSKMLSKPSSANDIWGFFDLDSQREYALIGVINGTSIFDISDAENPVQVGHISGASSTWRDVKVYQYYDSEAAMHKAYAYVTTESAQGLQIIDLNQLPQKVSLAATITNDFTSAHNVYVANVDYATGLPLPGLKPYLYVSGANKRGGVFRVYSLDNPVQPEVVAEGTEGYVHDVTTLVIDDERTKDCAPGHNPCEILVDFNESTVDLWDVTDKRAPLLISKFTYPGVAYIHSGWWSEDKQTIFIQDELDEVQAAPTPGAQKNTVMRAMDISNLKAPRLAGIYIGPSQAIDHNGFTVGNFYYMSTYRRGLTVIDVSDPTNMRDVGFFDTFVVPEANDASFNGAWGTYPFLPSGNIIVSDIEYGLWVLKMAADPQPVPGGTANPVATASPSAPKATPSTAPNHSSGGGSSAPWLLFTLLVLLRSSRYRFFKTVHRY